MGDQAHRYLKSSSWRSTSVKKNVKKHMKQCSGCGRWFTPKRKNQEYCTRACEAAYFSHVYWKQKQAEIDRELEIGGWDL